MASKSTGKLLLYNWSISTEIKGVVLVRLKYNTDLLKGLQQG